MVALRKPGRPVTSERTIQRRTLLGLGFDPALVNQIVGARRAIASLISLQTEMPGNWRSKMLLHYQETGEKLIEAAPEHLQEILAEFLVSGDLPANPADIPPL